MPLREIFSLPKKEERRVPLNFKVPETLRAALSNLQRMWRLRAKVQGATEAEVDAIDLTFVCNRLLDTGIDSAWDEVGRLAGLSGAPKNDEEWAALQKALEAHTAANDGR